MECSYCKNRFVNKYTLQQHQLKAKYCLKIQGKDNALFRCTHCRKTFSTNQGLQRHVSSCKKRDTNLVKEEYQRQLDEKDIQLEDQRLRYERQIKELQDKLENIALQAVKRPTTTNNQLTYIQNLQPLDDQDFITAAPKLTIEHIKKGAEGYADYALEFPLKDKLVCVDYARRKVKFKNKDGQVVTDPEMNTLATKFFDSIWDQNRQLTSQYGQELLGRGDASDMEEIERLISFGEAVRNSSGGMKTELQHDWVKSVCSRTVKN